MPTGLRFSPININGFLTKSVLINLDAINVAPKLTDQASSKIIAVCQQLQAEGAERMNASTAIDSISSITITSEDLHYILKNTPEDSTVTDIVLVRKWALNQLNSREKESNKKTAKKRTPKKL